MNMTWIKIALIAVAALSLVRIVFNVRRATVKVDNDWDTRFITQLRKAGLDLFKEHPVDFFFTLPTDQASRVIGTELEREGYHTDSRPEAEGGFSLHANREMRLVIDDMQVLTARFRTLAEQHGGTYDGWAVAKAKKLPSDA
ncbi:ribonuclease E inhibitor RraB [bacterium]|nr:MAG: ribonuclease E inhibitor RraB [bacterium]